MFDFHLNSPCACKTEWCVESVAKPCDFVDPIERFRLSA